MQGIDHAAAGGPGGGDDHHRNVSGRPVLGNGAGERRGVHAPAAVGIDQPKSAASDADLVSDLQPGDVAVARGVETRRPRESTSAVAREAGVRGGQCADQRRAVGLRAAGREMTRGAFAHAGAAGHRADEVVLERHRHGRGGRARQLRIEGGDDPIRALRGKIRAWIEQPEVARIRHLHDAMLQPLDAPAQHLLERTRRVEVHRLELGAECRYIDGGHDRSGLRARQRSRELSGQPGVDAAAFRGGWKQCGNGAGQSLIGHVSSAV
jgi:hypothetical protein